MLTKFYIYIALLRLFFFPGNWVCKNGLVLICILLIRKKVEHFKMYLLALCSFYPHFLSIFHGDDYCLLTAFHPQLSTTIWFVTCEYIKIKYNAYFMFLYVMICHSLPFVVHLWFWKSSQDFINIHKHLRIILWFHFFQTFKSLIYMQCILMLVHSRDITLCFVIPKWLTSHVKGDSLKRYFIPARKRYKFTSFGENRYNKWN